MPHTETSFAATRRGGTSARSEQRMRDILRVGREVFAEKGYERATTTEIAQRLGVSEATVFTYFHGKRELCVRVIADWYDEIIAAMEGGMPPDRPAREQLAYFVRTHLRLFLIQGTGLCALVLSEGRSKGQDFAEAFLPLQRRYTAPLMDLLARGRERGEIRQDLPLRLMRALVLGPVEHLLWGHRPGRGRGGQAGRGGHRRQPGGDAVAGWPRPGELAALRQFRQTVGEALARSGSAG
jgi:AcrR family transcriptional regulator